MLILYVAPDLALGDLHIVDLHFPYGSWSKQSVVFMQCLLIGISEGHRLCSS